MYIEKIHISNLKCFAGSHELDLVRPEGSCAGWTVFAGRNGSGKTTLLRAIAAAVVGPNSLRGLVGSVDRWVRTDERTCETATLIACDQEVDLYLRDRVGAQVFWSGLAMGLMEAGPNDMYPLVEEGGAFVPHIMRVGWMVPEPISQAYTGPWTTNPGGWFIAGYGAHRHLGPPPPDVLSRSADPVYARLVTLFNESATLSESVDWLKQVHLRALEEVPGAAALREAALAFLRQDLLPDGSTVVKVTSDGLWVRRDGVELPLEQVSDGYRTGTALVLDILRRLHATYGDLRLEKRDGATICPLPGVVLIDEVDAHLHVTWQQKIGFWLTKHFPNLQFLVTTHSPFICQAASPGGLIRLPGPGEDRKLEHVSDRLYTAITNGGVDAAVMTELFGMEYAHSPASEALRARVATLEVAVLDGVASEQQVQDYAALKAQLPDDLGDLADQSVRALAERLRAR